MIDTLSVATEGFVSNVGTANRPLAVATRGWVFLTAAVPESVPLYGGGGGGGAAMPLFVPGIAARPSRRAFARRARTVAAAMAVAITGGDSSAALAATLGLVLDVSDEPNA